MPAVAFPVAQWQIGVRLSAYSCGHSRGFAPHSLLVPYGNHHAFRIGRRIGSVNANLVYWAGWLGGAGEGGKTSPQMTRLSTSSEGSVWRRLLLMAMLGIALASRLALGATMPSNVAGGATAPIDSLARLQAVMVLCEPGQDHPRPPAAPHAPQWDDLLVFDQGDNAHALLSGSVPVPPKAARWVATVVWGNHGAPRLRTSRAAWNARDPPTSL
jgi:hypothetical protein